MKESWTTVQSNEVSKAPGECTMQSCSLEKFSAPQGCHCLHITEVLTHLLATTYGKHGVHSNMVVDFEEQQLPLVPPVGVLQHVL